MQSSGFAEASLGHEGPFALGARTQSDALFALPSPGAALGPSPAQVNFARDNLRHSRSADLGHRPTPARHGGHVSQLPGPPGFVGGSPIQQPRVRGHFLHARTQSTQVDFATLRGRVFCLAPSSCLSKSLLACSAVTRSLFEVAYATYHTITVKRCLVA